MKYFNLKFLTFFLTALLAFGVGWAETATLPNTQALTTEFVAVGGDPNIQISTSSANTYTNPLRFYANVTVTIKAMYDCKIQSVTYEASSTGNYVTYAQNATVTPEVQPTVDGKNVTWTLGDNVTEFTFMPSSQTRANSITITYTRGSQSSLTPVTLSFPKNSYTATLGQTFTAPTLSVNPDAAASEVAYSSSYTDVATVDANGNVRLVAAGITTITAAISGSDTYYDATASYSLTVEEALPEGSVIDFKETFAGCNGTGGNDGNWSGNIASTTFNDDKADNEGWALESGNAADECIKLGTGSKLGSATTPSISVTPGTVYTLTFKAAAWNANNENTILKLSATGGNLSVESVTMVNGAWTTYTITFTANSETATIKFEGYATSNSRFFLDQVVLYHDENAAITPSIAVNPTTLNIGEAGDSFTVTGSNLIDNIGVTPSAGFTTIPDPKPSENETWGFVNNDGSVDGTVTVNYTGNALNAEGTVTMGTKISWDPAEDTNATVTVNYLYDGDIYILGNYGNDWNYNDASHKMENNNGTYTATFEVPANSYVVFARKLSENGLWDDGRSYFGAPSNDYPVNQDEISGYLDVNNHYVFKIENAGEYTFTVNANDETFNIKKTPAPLGDITYEKVTSTDDVTTGNYLIVYEGGNVAFDGSLATLDVAHNNKSVNIQDGAITTSDAIYFTYDATAKTLKSAMEAFGNNLERMTAGQANKLIGRIKGAGAA